MNRVNPIVTVKWLAKLLESPSLKKNIRILDGSMHLPDAHRDAKAEYAHQHVPHALFFDIDACADLETNLPHMLPGPQDFESYVGKLGIHNDSHVVVYDTSDEYPLFSAERVWWTFRVFGHEKVSVLEGGLCQWRKQKYPMTDVVPEVPVEKFTAGFNAKLVKSFEEVEVNQYREKTFSLFDTRPADYYHGVAPSFMPGIKTGSIPGSINLPFPELMDVEQQTFKSKEELLKVFRQYAVDLSAPVVATCGSGIWACHLALAAYVCGKEDVAVYDGSWVEWFLKARPDQLQNVGTD